MKMYDSFGLSFSSWLGYVWCICRWLSVMFDVSVGL